MSRLIFLNLPPSITTSSFKSHLTSPAQLEQAQITDIKVNSKRRFAFVGYKSEHDASKAQAWFDGTFGFGGGKVKVDIVRDDPLGPKPSKRMKTAEKVPSAASIPQAGPSKQLQEFMNVMKGNDQQVLPGGTDALVPGDPGWKADGSKKDKSKSKSAKGKERQVEEEAGDEDDDDAAWLRKRQTAALEGDQDDGTEVAQKLDSESSLVLSTGRLFVRNLAFSVTSDDLSSLFTPFGHVESVHLPVSHSGEPLGTAFILFRDPQHALVAYRKLDKTTFQGRLLHVLPGRVRPGQEPSITHQTLGGEGQVLGKIKERRQDVLNKADQKRKEASSKGVNWATLYMNSDAVAGSVADRMGITKAELLNADPEDPSASTSAAVKLALAETHVIAETKAYFEEAGLNVESLQPRTPRSQTIILVKNIPYGTTIQALTDMFTPHGEITRMLLPPSGTLGVVEYKSSADAGRAFKALAYTRMGNAVLYLEKGPQGMFIDSSKMADKVAQEQEDQARILAEKVASAESRQVADESDEAGSTLFLKNLAFSTSTPRLQSILSSLPGYSFARVQTKPDPRRPGERLSMGYGFVGFKTQQEAQKAMAGLEGFEIDGKALEVKFAQRGGADQGDTGEKKADGEMGKFKGTKVMVKNLPFEASKKDIRDLFSAYGSIKALRIPKKSLPTAAGSKSTRGFGFIEFTTHTEAVRAMEALKHTHLLGRHLVLSWAKEDGSVDVDELRRKVGIDYKSGSGDGKDDRLGKKRKLDLMGTRGEQDDGLEIDQGL
ncbi:hypothetical protein BD324DRAFT_632729 [Kockovaella imperatae]|uniref:Multiple RNA-binding domain-containing protein 1 n=1 Tax=Kockovaella imperatae TaxID=4999 RepID=A0A1Y1UBL4_9TREE|nr:hypothetical protein BD324DRAFT_632729 [Kockovaella imperatae]ORX35409.1 hypothetical protein BD324DRAFT_632729 [Kockovaella imperatae]